jgi:hypothetical protein
MKTLRITFIACALFLLSFSGVEAQWMQSNGPNGGEVLCLVSNGPNLYAGTRFGL